MERRMNSRLTAAIHGIACASLLAIGSGSSTRATAAILFADSFDDGDIGDWSRTSNHGGASGIAIRTDLVVSPGGALTAFLEAPPGGSSLFSRASHGFSAAVTGDFTLTLAALSAPCLGCTISYDVIVDGVLLDRRAAPLAYEARRYDLVGLAAGSHTLTLGMFTDVAFAGRFTASFDDVVIASKPTTRSSGCRCHRRCFCWDRCWP
jgi:hypothetical protein